MDAMDWKKLETKAMPLREPREVLSPGLLDPALQHVVAFPKDGGAVDLGLPHFGQDKNGKDYPALQARLLQEVIWIDFDGNGKVDRDETRVVRPKGYSDPFTCDLHYEDGTSGQYIFRFKTIIDHEKYLLIRSMARYADFQNKRIAILDDDGNGKYSDLERDAVVVGEKPVTLLGKYVLIDKEMYEILVHDAGTAIEIRPAPKLEMGTVNLFDKAAHKYTQVGTDLRFHTLIVKGAQSFFALNEQHNPLQVPVGAYDLVFGIIERGKELVYVKNGEKTSFLVSAGQTAAPKWGGTVTAKFSITSDGAEITVNKPTFTGEGSEVYFPDSYEISPVRAFFAQVFVDSSRMEHVDPKGSDKFDTLPDGDLKPVVFKPIRYNDDEYQVSIEYRSGILGRVLGKERIQFVYRRKDKDPRKQQ